VGVRFPHIDEDDYESKAKTVIDAFQMHRQVLKQHSSKSDSISPKLVVVCDKQDFFRGMMRFQAFKQFRNVYQQVNICVLSSDFGIEINGIQDPRVNNKHKEKLLQKLRELESNDELVVFHVDMITESIDVTLSAAESRNP